MDTYEAPDSPFPRTVRSLLNPLSIAATVGMFVVLVMGATVTNTGSAEGCGRSWPLCNGQLIPEFAVSTLIEFSHRAVTGIETVLILALAVSAWLVYRRSVEIRVLVILMVAGLFLQAGMGAWAVLYPQSPLVLAMHFGISLVAFASVLLATTSIHAAQNGRGLRDHQVSRAYVWTTWGAMLFTLIVVYLGAYVRHANYVGACVDWPLCNGQLIPPLWGAVGVMFAHRLAAFVDVLLLGVVAAWSWRLRRERPDLANGAAATFALIVLQSLSGAFVVGTGLGLWSALTHAGIMALLFGSLCYVCLGVLPAASDVEDALRAGQSARRVASPRLG